MHRGLEVHCSELLREFRLELGLPVWRFEFPGFVLEKRILMPYLQNTVHITYRLIEGSESVLLVLRPSLGFRSHEEDVNRGGSEEYLVKVAGERIEISSTPDFPTLKMRLLGESSALTLNGGRRLEFFYRREAERGYAPTGGLWSPGHFSAQLMRGGRSP